MIIRRVLLTPEKMQFIALDENGNIQHKSRILDITKPKNRLVWYIDHVPHNVVEEDLEYEMNAVRWYRYFEPNWELADCMLDVIYGQMI